MFFGGLDPFTSVIFSFGTFAAGYLARPLGGVIFGHFGDRIGRKKMLVLTMFIMGVASFLIGLVPGSATIGAVGARSSWSCCGSRQGIAVGGEWGGAALMALEHAESGKRGFSASFVNAGAPSGALLGSLMLGLFALLPQDQFFSWGWRIPFLFSGGPAGHRHVRAHQGHREPGVPAGPGEGRRPSRRKQPLPLWAVLRRPKALILTILGCRRRVRLPGHHGHLRPDLRRRSGGADRSSVLFGLLGRLVPGHLRRCSPPAGCPTGSAAARSLVAGIAAGSPPDLPVLRLWGSGNASGWSARLHPRPAAAVD